MTSLTWTGKTIAGSAWLLTAAGKWVTTSAPWGSDPNAWLTEHQGEVMTAGGMYPGHLVTGRPYYQVFTVRGHAPTDATARLIALVEGAAGWGAGYRNGDNPGVSIAVLLEGLPAMLEFVKQVRTWVPDVIDPADVPTAAGKTTGAPAAPVGLLRL